MTAGRIARVVAQAKVNLLLRIHAREASGYHAIETLFCRLALGDHVELRALERSERSLDVAGADTGPVERNLAWRAALAFQERAGWPAGFSIAIEKRIPVGGGLGGGSADAGAVLRALNALAPRPLADAELLALALPLGSDVPFLTTTVPLALAWGRGERMLALPALPARRVVLATFSDGVTTADAYRWLAESRAAWQPTPLLLDPRAIATWDGVAALAANDFEPVVLARRPDIANARAALAPDGEVGAPSPITLMSGSGATVFRVDEGTPTREALAAGIRTAAISITTTAEFVSAVEAER